MKTQSVDAVRAGTSGALGWNLCLDENGGPHVDAGCDNCRGLATITSGDNPKFQLNAEFQALAQTSHYVQPGAFRIESSDPQVPGLQNVAFENPDGSKVIVIRNSSDQAQTVSTQMNGCEMGSTSIPAGGAVTLKWPKE
jgi:glucosylceramidase